MMLLGTLLVVWWYQSFTSDREQLRDAVETEVNRMISEDFVVHGLRAMVLKQAELEQGNLKLEVSPERFLRGLRKTEKAEISPPEVRVEQFEKNEDGLPKLVTISVGRLGEQMTTTFSFGADGISLKNLPKMVREAIFDKFGVDLRTAAGATGSEGLVVTARSVNATVTEKGARYQITGYLQPLLLGLLPEFLFGFFLFGATGFSFRTAYRNLREQEVQLRQKDALVANVAHELKTPIATVGVALEALNLFGADDDPGRRSDYLSIGQSELKRLDQMADRAIDALQAGALDARLKKKEVDLERVLEESWRGLRLRYELEDHQLRMDVHTNPVLWADPTYLYHLVYNLLDNACKYGGDPRDIRVVLTGGEDSLSLSVADNGPGVPLAERGKVFERFYRIRRPDEGHRTKGHGLGLSFVRQIVDAHRGWISLENASPVGGALFTVELPRFDRP